jgi:hypothetical protein
MIKTGRFGQVMWSASGSSPTNLISMKGWTLSLKTDYEDVSCFQDTNKVYIPGLRDISGTLTGFWNSDDVDLIQATEQTTPGTLELEPNTTEPGFVFSGLAYIDADIDCSVNGAPKMTGNFRAAGPWTIPVGSP